MGFYFHVKAQAKPTNNNFVNEIYFVLKTDTLSNKTTTIKRKVSYELKERPAFNENKKKQEKTVYYKSSIDSIPPSDISKIDSIYCDGKNKVENIIVSAITLGSDKYFEKPAYRDGLKYANKPFFKGTIGLELRVINSGGQKQELYFRLFQFKKNTPSK